MPSRFVPLTTLCAPGPRQRLPVSSLLCPPEWSRCCHSTSCYHVDNQTYTSLCFICLGFFFALEKSARVDALVNQLDPQTSFWDSLHSPTPQIVVVVKPGHKLVYWSPMSTVKSLENWWLLAVDVVFAQSFSPLHMEREKRVVFFLWRRWGWWLGGDPKHEFYIPCSICWPQV